MPGQIGARQLPEEAGDLGIELCLLSSEMSCAAGTSRDGRKSWVNGSTSPGPQLSWESFRY